MLLNKCYNFDSIFKFLNQPLAASPDFISHKIEDRFRPFGQMGKGNSPRPNIQC